MACARSVEEPSVLGSVWLAPSVRRAEVPAVCSALTLVKHRTVCECPGLTPHQVNCWLQLWSWHPSGIGPPFGEKHRSYGLCNLNMVSERKQNNKKQLRCHCDGLYSCKHSRSCKLFTCERLGCEFKAQTKCLCDEVLCIIFEEKCLVQALELLCLHPRKGLGEGGECRVCRRP